MLYTKGLLNKYLENLPAVDDISDKLILKVCEVEEIHKRELPKDLVIGYVSETRNHPDADKLTVCQVDCGKSGNYQICCGASNVREGIFVAVALPGCYLPAIDLKIEPRQLRGQDSNGMICSKAELGIKEDDEHKWIRSLTKSENAVDQAKGEIETVWDMSNISMSDLGTPLGEKYPWIEGWILDIENKTITHRPEMFGHYGLAVDLHTMYPETSPTEKFSSLFSRGCDTNFENLSAKNTHNLGINVESSLVSCYNTILIKDIQRKESDFQTRLLLMDLGLQSKSNWVDFSNIFMYETGQPIHFFDADKISGGLIIRQANDGETFTDLFEKEHKLTSNDIVISDNEKICALAGIVGSLSSGIDKNTKNILVEIANFDAIQVRRTGNRLGLRTDAELRFEKTIHPLWAKVCTDYFVEQFSEAGLSGSIEGIKLYEDDGKKIDLQKINLDRDFISSLIGTDSKESGTKVLSDLGMKVEQNSLTIPVWRSPEDIETNSCLVEEITRIIGFETIDSIPLESKSKFVPFSIQINAKRALEGLMIERFGFDQVETYPWVHKKRIKTFEIDENALFQMKNSLNPDWIYLRPSIIPLILECIEKNSPFYDTLKVFDIGQVWHAGETIREHTSLGFGLYNKKGGSGLEHSFLSAKNIIDEVLKIYKIKGKLSYSSTNKGFYHPKQQSILLLNGKEIGTLNTLHPYEAEIVKMPGDSTIILGEISLASLKDIVDSNKKSTLGNSSYETLQDQILYRDLNFLLDTETTFGEVISQVKKVKEVKDIEVFDLYVGEHIPENKKSISLRMKIIGEEELETEQINNIMNNAIENVSSIGGELR